MSLGPQPHFVQRLDHKTPPLNGVRLFVEQMQRLGDQPLDLVARVERAVRVLEYHLHVAARAPQFRTFLAGECLAQKADSSCTRPVKCQHHARQRRFSAAGTADKRHRLARLEHEGDAVHGSCRFAGTEQRQPPARIDARDIFHLQQRRRNTRMNAMPGPRGHVHRGLGELACVGMELLGERTRGFAFLHHRAAAHDGDAVGHVGDNGEVVRNQEQAHAVLVDQVAQQLQNLLLQHHVERGRRLVGDQELGLERAGDGNDDALPLAAGKLMRIARQRELGFRQPDPVEHLSRTVFRIPPARAGVPADALRNLLADRLHRVQRRHWLLEHHADVVAAKRIHLVFAGCENIYAVKADASGSACRRRQQAHHGERRHRLAGAGFADQPHDLAGLDRQIDAVEDRRSADLEVQAFDFEQAHRALLSFGSSTSERPSPSRLRPSTVSTMAKPGNSARCGAMIMRVCASNSMRPQLGIGGWEPRPT